MTTKRLLVAIPHYYGPSQLATQHRSSQDHRQHRATILGNTILSLHRCFGQAQSMMQIAKRRTDSANTNLRFEVSVIVCTTATNHLFDEIDYAAPFAEHRVVQVEPTKLGYACHDVLAQFEDQFDWFVYLEDDLRIHDPLFFEKLAWFHQQFGIENLLQPNRFEVGSNPIVTKAYVDGDLLEKVTEQHQNVHEMPTLEGKYGQSQYRFARALNPHSGCFFLSKPQLAHWKNSTAFQERVPVFVGPLESSASYSIMKAFKVYKPAVENAAFFEVEHQSTQFISQLRKA